MVRRNNLEDSLRNETLANISMVAALDIDRYIGKKEVHSNNFVKLSELILGTLNSRDYLEGKREIDAYPADWFLLEVLKKHKEKIISKGRNPTYILSDKIYSKLKECEDQLKERGSNLGYYGKIAIRVSRIIGDNFTEDLIPTIHKVGNDLKNFAQFQIEKQEELRDLTLAILRNTYQYRENFKHYLAA
ncbi:MAG: hypothetical protein AABW50_04420 [Nanoarchaeota archaeon]